MINVNMDNDPATIREDSNNNSSSYIDVDYIKKYIYAQKMNSKVKIYDPDNFFQLFSPDQMGELLSLLEYYSNNNIYKACYGTPYILVVSDEYDKPAYIKLIFPNCNWEEWKLLDKDLTNQENLLKGYVMIECVKGLIE